VAALGLTCLGIYGVLSYAVAVRQREFGVRRAIGAGTIRVMGAIVREGVGLATAGAALGLVVAWLAAVLLAGQLYGVAPRDPATYAAGFGVVLAAAVGACVLPARRAASISPMDALRGE
jgi:putative ABC transport system permease protein